MDDDLYNVRSVWILVTHISISGFVFVYTLGVFDTCTDNVAASLGWNSEKDWYVHLFSFFLPIGQTLGCILATPAIERLGRRKLLMVSDVLFITGSIILVMPSTIAFGFGRIITGLATGTQFSVTPVFINEITPESMMPKVGPMLVICANTGLVCSYGLGLMLPLKDFSQDPLNNMWILMFLFPALLSLYQFFYFLLFMKYEPPQFYMLRNMKAEEKNALEITHKEISIVDGLRRVKSEVDAKEEFGVAISLVGMLCNKKFFKMVRISIFLSLLSQLTGSTPIIFYSTEIFQTIGGGLFQARLMTFLMGVAFLISTICTSWILKYLGRKTVLIYAQLLVAIDLTVVGLCMRYFQTNPTISAVFIIIYFIPLGVGLDATFWAYSSEVLNDQLMSLMCILSMAFGILVSYLFPPSANYFGTEVCFYFFAVCMLFTAIYSYLDLVETRDKKKEEILIEMKVMSPNVLEIKNTFDHIDKDMNSDNREKYISSSKITNQTTYLPVTAHLDE